MKLPITEGFFRSGHLMQATLSPVNLEEGEELIKLLEDLGNLKAEYPPELLATRRATFIAQIEQWEKAKASHQPHSKKQFIQL